MTSLPLIIEEALLPTGARGDLQKISAELMHTYSARQIFRTDTEARVSVLDDLHFPTKASKYWQALREQSVMFEQLALLSFEYRRNEVQIKRFTRSVQKAEDELDREDAEVNLDEAMFKRSSMQTVAADRVREILMWSKIKNELDDGSFDTRNVNTHQLISYTVQFALMAANTDPAQMTGPESQNLLGQLQSSLNRCQELGVLNEVKTFLPVHVQEQLRLQA